MIIDDIESMEEKENLERLEREFKPMSRTAKKHLSKNLNLNKL